MVFITYKVLNLVFSDTIACVLELLFGIVYGLFPRPLNVSIQAFDIVQFSRSCWLPLSKQLAYYNSLCFVCQALFELFFLQAFKWKQPFQPFGWPLSCDSLLIILLQTTFVNYFFKLFSNFCKILFASIKYRDIPFNILSAFSAPDFWFFTVYILRNIAYNILHYIQQKKGLGFQSPECIIKPKKPVCMKKYKLFEKSLKK